MARVRILAMLVCGCLLTLPTESQRPPGETLDGADNGDPSDTPICAEGWESLMFPTLSTFRGPQVYCFQKLPGALGWTEAQGECWSRYSHLLVLNQELLSSNTNAVREIGDLLQGMGLIDAPFWLAMHVDHNKLWWDGRKISQVYRHPHKWEWSGGQPVSTDGHCAQVTFTKTAVQATQPQDPVTFPRQRRAVPDSDLYTYKVSVSLQNGETKLPAVCVNQGFSPMLLKDEKLCGPGWFGSVYVDMCLWHSGSVKMNYSSAEKHCQSMGGHLVVMNSNYKTKIIIRFMQNKPKEEVWQGFTKEGSTYSWVDGKKWESDNNVIKSPSDGCGSFGSVQSTSTAWWFVQECTQNIPFVCEKPLKNLDPPEISRQPESLTLPLSYIQPSEHMSTLPPTRTLTCGVKHYYPHFPVVWVKDGMHIPTSHYAMKDNGESPLNVDVNLLRAMGGVSGNVQGYYWCETVAATMKKRHLSQKALVKFDGLLTYVGSLRVRGSVISYEELAAENLFVTPNRMVIRKPKNMLRDLVRETQNGIPGLTITANIEQYRKGSVVIDYRMYVEINKQRFLPPDVDVERDEQVRYIVFEKMQEIISDKSSTFSTKYAAWDIDPDNVTITSVDSCPVTYLIHPHSQRKLWLMSTPVGGTAKSIPCLADRIPLVTARCQGDFINGASWVDINFHMECKGLKGSSVTDALIRLSELRLTLLNAVNVSEEMLRLTQDPDILTTPDLVYTSHIMSNIAKVRNVKVDVGDQLVSTMSSLMKSDANAISTAQSINQASKRMVRSLDQFATGANLGDLKSKQFIQPNIAMQIQEFHNDSKPVLGFQSSSQKKDFSEKSLNNLYGENDLQVENVEAAILFPEEVFSKESLLQEAGPDADFFDLDNMKTRVAFTVYQKDDLFQTPSRLNKSQQYTGANSRIIAGSIAGRTIKNLKNPVQTVFQPIREISNSEEVRCVFWDFEANEGIGDWSTEGCWYSGTQNGRHICSCNHLTNFAILIDMYDEPVDPNIEAALSYISMIGLALSILGLAMTVITFIAFAKFRKNRSQKTTLNLALALLAAMIIFVVGIERTENYYGCMLVAMLLHYFILVAFAWMLVEAILNYIRFVKVFGTYIPNFMLKTAIPAWTIPLLPIIIVASIDYKLYRGRDNYCWMALTPLYYAFLLPIGLIIVTNAVLYILVIKGMTCDRGKGLKTNQSKNKLAWMQVNASLSAFVVLGLTWIFAFLAIADARVAFQFLFCIFNSIQGFLIFFFHMARSKQVRNAWVRVCCPKSRQEKYLAPSTAAGESTSNRPTTSTTTGSTEPSKA